MIDNMNPEIWGKSFWKVIHLIGYNYSDNPSDEDKKNVNDFFDLIGQLLPCEKCRLHYKNHMMTYKLTDNDLISKDTLFKWTVNLHNVVNSTLNKKQLTEQDVIDKYIFKNKKYNNKNIIIILLLISILILLIIILKKNK
jgi:hypothetical protein